MDYVMRRRSTEGGALEMFSLPLPLPLQAPHDGIGGSLAAKTVEISTIDGQLMSLGPCR